MAGTIAAGTSGSCRWCARGESSKVASTAFEYGSAVVSSTMERRWVISNGDPLVMELAAVDRRGSVESTGNVPNDLVGQN